MSGALHTRAAAQRKFEGDIGVLAEPPFREPVFGEQDTHLKPIDRMPTGNRILDMLPPDLRDLVVKAGRPVELPVRTPMADPNKMPEFVYFLTRGAASVVIHTVEGASAEVGMIGNEGLVNAVSLLGLTPAQTDTFIQLAGAGLRVPLRAFRDLFEQHAELRDYVLQFLQAQVVITGQLSACNRLHEAEARLARWLLTAADLTHQDVVRLTQEFLAEMLGSQRTTVALVAGALQRAGHIDYSRGTVRILSRKGLESATCDCYGINRRALQPLYRPYSHGS